MLALIGGAFDPIHDAHIKLIKALSKTYTVWVAPCVSHSFDKIMAPLNHRLNMIKLVTNAPIKIFREKYTIDVIKKIKQPVCVVIGQDNANEIEKWQRGEELANKIPFVVVARKGCNVLRGWYLFSPHKFMNLNLPEISSTEIRDKIRTNQKVEKVSKKVLKYIRQNNLYRSS